jgi:two-component system cell cycle response regulator DivK
VEDDPDVRTMYARYLSRHGLRVQTAMDGMEALHLASTRRPSIVIMDRSLPHIDGWEATRRLKRDPATRDTLVIACTGHLPGGSVQLALDAGCDAYVVKPCVRQDLLAEIHRALARQRSDR